MFIVALRLVHMPRHIIGRLMALVLTKSRRQKVNFRKLLGSMFLMRILYLNKESQLAQKSSCISRKTVWNSPKKTKFVVFYPSIAAVSASQFQSMAKRRFHLNAASRSKHCWIFWLTSRNPLAPSGFETKKMWQRLSTTIFTNNLPAYT